MDQEQPRLDGFPTRSAEAACDESDWTLEAAKEIVAAENKTGYAPVDLIQEIIREHMDDATVALDLRMTAGASVDIPGYVDTLIITAAEGSTINVQNVRDLAIEQGSGSQVIFADGAAEATIMQGPGSVIQYNRGKP